MKKFDREAIFAEVDASNKRFETYTEEQRKQFSEEARRLREQEESQRLASHAVIAACCAMM